MTCDVTTIAAAIENLDDSKQVDIYNDYAEANNHERIYFNDEKTLNMLFISPTDAITHLHHDYRVFHDYCMFDDSSGLLVSSNYPYDSGWIYPEDIARWLLRSSLLSEYIEKYDLDIDYDELESEDNAD